MCIFGGGGAAKPTVSASDSINSAAPYAPVQRPDSPVAQLYRMRAQGTLGQMGNVTRSGHLSRAKKLTDPKATATKLGGVVGEPAAEDNPTLRDRIEGVAEGIMDRAIRLKRRYL